MVDLCTNFGVSLTELGRCEWLFYMPSLLLYWCVFHVGEWAVIHPACSVLTWCLFQTGMDRCTQHYMQYCPPVLRGAPRAVLFIYVCCDAGERTVGF